ncbi:MAG: chemotaxis protein CheW [Deltaproteobacteria bacterium]|nr:hypothetical protein [Myxococcales bacterium]MDP3217503.1 chemotaxis protein CheW [Deltaproteobacteria bacterium]
MSDEARADDRAAELRRAFDRSFAEAPAAGGAAPESVLAVRICDDPYAFRAAEVVALHRDLTVSPYVAGVARALLGLAVFRGVPVPVYDLGELFGAPPGAAPRWAVLARAPSLVALAFERFEAHALVGPEHLVAAPPGARAGALVRGGVIVGGALRPLVHVASVVDAIGRRARPPGEEP